MPLTRFRWRVNVITTKRFLWKNCFVIFLLIQGIIFAEFVFYRGKINSPQQNEINRATGKIELYLRKGIKNIRLIEKDGSEIYFSGCYQWHFSPLKRSNQEMNESLWRKSSNKEIMIEWIKLHGALGKLSEFNILVSARSSDGDNFLDKKECLNRLNDTALKNQKRLTSKYYKSLILANSIIAAIAFIIIYFFRKNKWLQFQ
jgi:hypothetical protein